MEGTGTPPSSTQGTTRPRSEASPGEHARAYSRNNEPDEQQDAATSVTMEEAPVEGATVEDASTTGTWPSLTDANSVATRRRLPPQDAQRPRASSRSSSSDGSRDDGPPPPPLHVPVDDPLLPSIPELDAPQPRMQPPPQQHPGAPVHSWQDTLSGVAVPSPWFFDQSSNLWYHIPHGTYHEQSGAQVAAPDRTGSDTISHHSGVDELAGQLGDGALVRQSAVAPPEPMSHSPSPKPVSPPLLNRGGDVFLSNSSHQYYYTNHHVPSWTSGVSTPWKGLALISLFCVSQAPLGGLGATNSEDPLRWAEEAQARARAILLSAPPPPEETHARSVLLAAAVRDLTRNPMAPDPADPAQQNHFQPAPPEVIYHSPDGEELPDSEPPQPHARGAPDQVFNAVPDQLQQAEAGQPPTESDDDVLYFVLSRVGNSTRYAREDVEETITLELERSGDPDLSARDDLPAIMSGDGSGPFKGKAYRKQALALFEQGVVDLFDKRGEPQTFDVYHIDAHGDRIFSAQETEDMEQRRDERQAAQAAGRERAEADDKRRNVVIIYNLLLHRCNRSTAATDPALSLDLETRLITEAAQRACRACPMMHRITVHQHVHNGYRTKTLTTYVLFKEGTPDSQIAACDWTQMRFITVERGFIPMYGVMTAPIRTRLHLAACCLRSTIPVASDMSEDNHLLASVCPGTSSCLLRTRAWRAAGFTPAQRGPRGRERAAPMPREDKEAKRARLEAENARKKQNAKDRLTQAKLKSLCSDFQKGEVNATHNPSIPARQPLYRRMHAVPPWDDVRAQARRSHGRLTYRMPVGERRALPARPLPLQGPRGPATRTGERPAPSPDQIPTQMDPARERRPIVQLRIANRHHIRKHLSPKRGTHHGLPVQLHGPSRPPSRQPGSERERPRGQPSAGRWLLSMRPPLQEGEIPRASAQHVGGDQRRDAHPHQNPSAPRRRHAPSPQHQKNLHPRFRRRQICATAPRSKPRLRLRLNFGTRSHPCRKTFVLTQCSWHSANWLALHHRLSWMVEGSSGAYA